MVKVSLENAVKSLCLIVLIALIGAPFASCQTTGGSGKGEEKPSGTGWLSSSMASKYVLPAAQPQEASGISWEVDKDDDLLLYLTWSASGASIDAWLESDGWGGRDPASGVDGKGNVAYIKTPYVLAYGVIGTNRYVIVVSK